MQKYLKKPNEFKAIQFTGGEANGKLVIEWLHQHVSGAPGNCSWQTHSPETINGREWITLGRRTIKPGMWITVDSHFDELTIFTEAEFERLFVPVQEFTEEYVSNEEAESSDEAVNIMNVSVQAAAAADVVISMLKGRQDQLHFVKQVSKRVAEWISSEQLKTNSEYGQDEAVISNGVIDSVSGADYVIEYTKHNEDTLSKVYKALMSEMPSTTTRRATELVNAMQNAGIVFREVV